MLRFPLFLLPIFAAVSLSASVSVGTVAVSSPQPGASVASPVSLSANATSCQGQSVTAMGYSVDSSPRTTIVNGQAINASVTAALGAHTLHVKAWGPKGASCVSNLSLTVIDPPPPVIVGSVIVSSPAAGNVSSPFELDGSAANCGSEPVSSMGYSLDGSPQTTIVAGQSVKAAISAALGAHTLHVKAWGPNQAACVTDVAITVLPPGPAIPPSAVSVSSLQSLTNWKEGNDLGVGSGTSDGVMTVVNTPSQSGFAREFATSYTDYGGERYWVSFGDDTEAHNFVYDGWIYFASTSGVANLEMDMNQVTADGYTYIYGFQCDGWTGTWDYTENSGTPEAWNDTWLHSKQPCNVRNWTLNAWHHVQVSYARDDAGNVTYQSVWLDGQEQDLNVTVPSAFALGWQPVLLTNIQIDGATGGSGNSVVYLDNLTVYRW